MYQQQRSFPTRLPTRPSLPASNLDLLYMSQTDGNCDEFLSLFVGLAAINSRHLQLYGFDDESFRKLEQIGKLRSQFLDPDRADESSTSAVRRLRKTSELSFTATSISLAPSANFSINAMRVSVHLSKAKLAQKEQTRETKVTHHGIVQTDPVRAVRTKRIRKTKEEILRNFCCDRAGCAKSYGCIQKYSQLTKSAHKDKALRRDHWKRSPTLFVKQAVSRIRARTWH